MRNLAAPFVALCLLGACQAPVEESPNRTSYLTEGMLELAQPSDVAVAPVRNQSGDEEIPVDAVRERLYGGLIDRLYSPLDMDFVDSRWKEAAANPDAIGADAFLQVAVTEWDTQLLEVNGALFVKAEVLLIDPKVHSRPLWGATLARRLELGRDRTRMPRTADLYARGAELLADEILAVLPERDPLAESR